MREHFPSHETSLPCRDAAYHQLTLQLNRRRPWADVRVVHLFCTGLLSGQPRYRRVLGEQSILREDYNSSASRRTNWRRWRRRTHPYHHGARSGHQAFREELHGRWSAGGTSSGVDAQADHYCEAHRLRDGGHATGLGECWGVTLWSRCVSPDVHACADERCREHVNSTDLVYQNVQCCHVPAHLANYGVTSDSLKFATRAKSDDLLYWLLSPIPV